MQRLDGHFFLGERFHRLDRRLGGRNRGDAWHTGLYGRRADLPLVRSRALAAGRVNHQLDLAVVQEVEQIRTTFGQLEHPLNRHASGFQLPGRALGGQQFAAKIDQTLGQRHNRLFVAASDTDEDETAARQQHAGGQLALRERDRKPLADSHDLARAPHFGAEHNVDAGEFAERKHALFHRHMRGNWFAFDPQFAKLHAGHHLRGDFRDRQPGRLRHKRHRAARARIDFQHVDLELAVLFFHRELDVHKPDDPQPPRHRLRGLADFVHHRGRQAVRRNRARRVARVDARFLDVLHHSHDHDIVAVRHAVDIHFRGVFQEPVDQHRLALGHDERLGDKPLELRFVVANLHRAATQDEARTNQRRETDLGRFQPRLVQVAGDAVGRLVELQVDEQLLEFLAILRRFDRVDAGADNRHASRVQRPRQIERCLAAELNDHAFRLYAVEDIQHILGGQRLEEQHIARVVIGADGFRVRVDHDRLDPQLAQREARVAAAVIEFDALANAVRPATQDHHAAPARLLRRRLVLVLVCRIVIRRVRFEFGRARIDRLERGDHTHRLAIGANLGLGRAPERRQLTIGEAKLLGAAKELAAGGSQSVHASQFLFKLDKLVQLIQEPRIDVRERMDFGQRHPGLHRVTKVPNPFVVGRGQLAANVGDRGLLGRTP